jgi:hypothetical protein
MFLRLRPRTASRIISLLWYVFFKVWLLWRLSAENRCLVTAGCTSTSPELFYLPTPFGRMYQSGACQTALKDCRSYVGIESSVDKEHS